VREKGKQARQGKAFLNTMVTLLGHYN